MKIGDISKAVIGGFLITVVTVFVVPLIIVPAEHRSEYFWFKVIWAEVLSTVFWSYIAWAHQAISRSSQQGSRQAAIVPGMGVAVFLYCGLSLFFLLSSAISPDNEWLSRFQLARQVIITSIFLISCIGLFMIGKHADKDNVNIGADVTTPEQLAVILQAEESRINKFTGETAEIKRFAQAYKSLREKISYSLPSINIIGNDPQYADFTMQVNALANSVRTCNGASLVADGLQEKTDNLISQITVIASRFKR